MKKLVILQTTDGRQLTGQVLSYGRYGGTVQNERQLENLMRQIKNANNTVFDEYKPLLMLIENQLVTVPLENILYVKLAR